MPITLRSSASRRDIIIVASIIFLITVIFSFRTIFTENSSWRRPTGDLPTFGSEDSTTTSTGPSDIPEKEKINTSIGVTAKPSKTVFYGGAPTSTSSALESSTTSLAALATHAASCAGFPNTDDILVVMKTGATEAYDKLPIHFLSTLLCNNDTIIFSDMEMNVAGHHVIDVLTDISEEVKKDNNDFELYRQLQEYYRLHEDPRELKVGPNGWNLDKYKFIHMLLKTYKYRPDVPWYLFVEADTAIMWDNLRTLLDKFDPTKPFYLGSPTYLDIQFAHGGTGYAISGAAMEQAVGKHLDIDKMYDKDVQGICCGDRMIARVLLDEKIHLTKVWPMFNGEKPLTFPFGKQHWCQPIVTMHHMTAQEVSQVYNFEQQRKAQGITTPLIFLDIFNEFVKPNLDQAQRDDWSNLSDDIRFSPPGDNEPDKDYYGRKWSELTEAERSSPESAENCRKACEANNECFQWQHHDRECALHRSIRLGTSKREGDRRYTSGWRLDKIEDFEKEMNDCRGGLDWTYHKADSD